MKTSTKQLIYIKNWRNNNRDKVRAAQRKYYYSHPEGRKKEYLKRKLDQLQIAFAVNKYKEYFPCQDCNQNFEAVCMDFDHVRGLKLREVSQLIATGRNFKVIFEEISKCELVCSNCHRKRTKQRSKGNYRFLSINDVK